MCNYRKLPSKCLALLVLLLAVVLSGCKGSPNEAYLVKAEPVYRELATTWRDLSQYPSETECQAIEARLQAAEEQLEAAVPTPTSQDFHRSLLDSIALQKEELVIKKELAALKTTFDAGEISQEEFFAQGETIFEGSIANTEKMQILHETTQGQLDKL